MRAQIFLCASLTVTKSEGATKSRSVSTPGGKIDCQEYAAASELENTDAISKRPGAARDEF